MASAAFRGLVDWCAGGGAARRRQVAGALVYLYDGPRTPARGAWLGILTCTGGDEPRFEGELSAIDGAEPLALRIRLTEDGAWAELRGQGLDATWAKGLPVVDVAARGTSVEARFDTGRDGQRLSCFAAATYARPRVS